MSLELPRADKPEDVGLSSERLQRLTDTLKSDIDKGIVPGAVALIARRGEIAFGFAVNTMSMMSASGTSQWCGPS